jgi:hypothetical protein
VDLFALELFNIAISRKWSTVKGIEGRLAADVLWPGRPSRSCRSHLSAVNIEIDVDVLVNDRLATVRGKCAIRYFRRCGLLKDVVSAAGGRVVAIILVEALSLHDGRSTPGAVFVNINVAMISWSLVVLMEAKVIVIVSPTTISSTAAAAAVAIARGAALPHALKPRAIPALTTSSTRRCRRVIIAIQWSG